ncbi:hypothetical protein SMJ63A_140073 [Stenotrophomonas geniculata]
MGADRWSARIPPGLHPCRAEPCSADVYRQKQPSMARLHYSEKRKNGGSTAFFQ